MYTFSYFSLNTTCLHLIQLRDSVYIIKLSGFMSSPDYQLILPFCRGHSVTLGFRLNSLGWGRNYPSPSNGVQWSFAPLIPPSAYSANFPAQIPSTLKIFPPNNFCSDQLAFLFGFTCHPESLTLKYLSWSEFLFCPSLFYLLGFQFKLQFKESSPGFPLPIERFQLQLTSLLFYLFLLDTFVTI